MPILGHSFDGQDFLVVCHRNLDPPLVVTQICHYHFWIHLLYFNQSVTFTMGEKKIPQVFIKDPNYGWIPAQVMGQSGDKVDVKVPQYKDEQAITCDGGKSAKGADERVINLKDYAHKVLPLQNVDGNNRLQTYADMTKLPYLHEVRITRKLLWLFDNSLSTLRSSHYDSANSHQASPIDSFFRLQSCTT